MDWLIQSKPTGRQPHFRPVDDFMFYNMLMGGGKFGVSALCLLGSSSIKLSASLPGREYFQVLSIALYSTGTFILSNCSK